MLNGVVMVTLFNELKNHGMAPEEAVVKGALLRLRTVLMTALLASLGLLPMALSTGIGAERARDMVAALGSEVTLGMVYEGKVVRLMDFGAFVQILPGKDGLVHISQISEERVERVATRGEQ